MVGIANIVASIDCDQTYTRAWVLVSKIHRLAGCPLIDHNPLLPAQPIIPKMAKKELFDDSSDDEEDRLHVNKSYAKEYQSRKQHEELLNTTALDEDEDDGSTSESEDEDGELLTPTVDVNILKTLKAVRNRDSSIYDRNQVFYESDDPGDADDEASERDTSRKRKAKRWKDVVRERALKKMEETGTDSGDDDDDDDDEKDLSEDQRNSHDGNPSRLAYNEEQRELRAAFIQSTNRDNEDGEEDDDDMLFVKKQKTAADAKAEKELMEEYEALEKTKPSSNLVDPRGEVKDGEKFLMDFFKHKRWVEEDDEDEAEDEGDNAAKGNKRVLSAPSDDDDDSIAELDKADDFEAQYNFRFEEAAAAAESGADFSNVGYARGGTMQTLRRPDDVRRQKRLERKERKAAERRAKEEQLRRLKNARREQMEGKLREVKKVLGSVNHDESQIDEDAMMKLLEGDYDPDKFEKLMANAYGDEFYKKEDAEWKNDADVRRTLMQDEDDGNALVGQDDEDGGLYDNGEDEYDDDDGEQEGQDDAEGYDDENDEVFAPVDGETSIEKKLKAKMQEELYKLDYEDIVAGMPTRFKYRQVEANNYGLSTQEILFARDSRLKSFVSLKKMAPYRDEVSRNMPLVTLG